MWFLFYVGLRGYVGAGRNGGEFGRVMRGILML